MTIQERLAEVEQEFEKVKQAEQQVQSQLQALQAKQLELRGAYQLLKTMEQEEAVKEPEVSQEKDSTKSKKK